MVKNGRVRQHVMRDFSRTPLTNKTQLNNWLRFYSMKTPLTAVGTIVSAETVSESVIWRIDNIERRDTRSDLNLIFLPTYLTLIAHTRRKQVSYVKK